MYEYVFMYMLMYVCTYVCEDWPSSDKNLSYQWYRVRQRRSANASSEVQIHFPSCYQVLLHVVL